MLNELYLIERGLRAAGVEIAASAVGINWLSKTEKPIRVRLGPDGNVTSVELVHPDLAKQLWTQRDGKKNSFPLVKFATKFLSKDDRKKNQEAWKKLTQAKRKDRLRQALSDGAFDPMQINGSFVGPEKIRERLQVVEFLSETETSAIPAIMKRFILFNDQKADLLSEIATTVVKNALDGGEDWFEHAKKILTDKCSLYFDVPRNEFPVEIGEERSRLAISRAFGDAAQANSKKGKCSITGDSAALLCGNFPEVNLSIGQKFLYSKNEDIEAAWRYGRFGDGGIPIGAAIADRMAGALRALTSEERLNKTWRSVAGERPKQRDLLLAFVEAAPDEAIIPTVAHDGEEAESDGEKTNSVAQYEIRTQRILNALEAKIGADFRKTPVQITLLRSVDKGNAKTLLHRQLSLHDLFEAAKEWSEGERNVPPWFTLPVPGKKGEKGKRLGSLHVAPLQLPRLTQRQYIRGGLEQRELTGVTASDAFALFLNEGDVKRQTRLMLHLLLRRYSGLLSGATHALRRERARKKSKGYNHVHALQGISLLGILLLKLERRKEAYMNESAFKLGQLLAAADTVHVGYCADMRGGDVPPTLLGNSVLAVAQSNPVKALAMLCARWKPYGGWAKHVDLGKADTLCNSKDKEENNRGWAMRRAVSQVRRTAEITRELHHAGLPPNVNDTFRAELLLGYLAGLPKVERDDEGLA